MPRNTTLVIESYADNHPGPCCAAVTVGEWLIKELYRLHSIATQHGLSEVRVSAPDGLIDWNVGSGYSIHDIELIMLPSGDFDFVGYTEDLSEVHTVQMTISGLEAIISRKVPILAPGPGPLSSTGVTEDNGRLYFSMTIPLHVLIANMAGK